MRANRSVRSSAAQQRGISFVGLVFVAAVLGCLGVVVAQVIPTVIEYQAILKAARKAANDGVTVPEVRSAFARSQAIDDFQSVTAKDIDVKKVNDKIVVSFAYDREIPLFGPAFLVIKYKGEGQTN